MNLNVDKQWFMDSWARRGLSLRKVASLIDMDAGALSHTLSGKRQMKVVEVGKIATVLGVSREEVLAHIEGKDAVPVADDVAMKKSIDKPATARISDHPGFGFMKGRIKIEEGFDITGPFDDEPWDEGYLGVDR